MEDTRELQIKHIGSAKGYSRDYGYHEDIDVKSQRMLGVFSFGENTTYTVEDFVYTKLNKKERRITTLESKRVWWLLWLFKSEVATAHWETIELSPPVKYLAKRIIFGDTMYTLLISKIEE